jgi:ElaB/YqjD/DUF883 family membrane-anchored ribosome-binding protein
MIAQDAGDDRSAALPDGTDTVIEGAARTDEGSAATAESQRVGDDRQDGAARGNSAQASSDGTSERGLAERLRSGREQFASQAGERTRGIVTQGLERTSEALANVSRMVGDTASGIDERLGSEYGDYARRAAGAIENAANTLAEKDPDELIEDTRNFVRNSPGVALAGAAVVGFVLARLFKTGLARDDDEDDA